MLLKEKRKRENKNTEERYALSFFAGEKIEAETENETIKSLCRTCEKIHGSVCWDEQSDLISDWLKEKRQQGTKRKHDDDQSSMAHAHLVFSF